MRELNWSRVLPSTPDLQGCLHPGVGDTSSIQFHSKRAAAEREIADESVDPGSAAIHQALADMHEAVRAKDINDNLSPLRRSPAWRRFAHLIISRYFLVEALRSAFQPLQKCAKVQRLWWPRKNGLTGTAAISMNADDVPEAAALV